MESEINSNENNNTKKVYTFIDRTQSDQHISNVGLSLLLQRDLLIRNQQRQQQEERYKSAVEQYESLDGKTDVESFIMVLAEKHAVSHRKAAKIIAKINDKKANPDQTPIIDWIKGIYDKAAEFGTQEQRAVFNILQEKNWTELLKDKDKSLNFSNKLAQKWKFSKEELAGQTIETAQKVYSWYEKATKFTKYLPSASLSNVMAYTVKAVAATGLMFLKYRNNNKVVNNKELFEMIESFKTKNNKEEAHWVKENLDKFKENFPNRSFNNQKQFMNNVETLYGSMDFNTKRMFASADPVVVINLIDEAARKVKFKLFDKVLDEEKIKDFHYEIMGLVLEKMQNPDFRKTMITQNVAKDKKDVLEVLKVFEFEKRNFILDGLEQWNATVSSYRLDLEKTRDELNKVKFALAGNTKAQEYIIQVFDKIDKIDEFFLSIEKEDTKEIFDKVRIFESFCHGQGQKPLRKNYQEKFDQLNVRELDTLKNHLEYALRDNDNAKKNLQEVFSKVYSFKPQSHIDNMRNKWEISLASVNKNMKDFNEKTDRTVFDYVKQGVSVVSSGLYKLAYAGSKLIDSIKQKEVREGVDILINSVSLGLKGVGLIVEISAKTIIEKYPEWYIKIENKLNRADAKIVKEYGLSAGKDLIGDLNQNGGFILKGMLLENIKLVEKHREETEKNKNLSNNSNSPPKVK